MLLDLENQFKEIKARLLQEKNAKSKEKKKADIMLWLAPTFDV